MLSFLQEYAFQGGALFNLAAVSAISLYIFYMIQKECLPPPRVLRPHVISLFAMCVVAVIISASCNTASLFCDSFNGGNSKLVDRNGSVPTYVKVAYIIAFAIPAGAMNVFNVIGFGISIHYIYFNVREILPLLRRLIVHNLIIMMLYIPAAIMFFATSNTLATNIGSLMVSSAGVFFSISYFYFAIYVDKLMPTPAVRSLLESPALRARSSSDISPSPFLTNESLSKNESSLFELRDTMSSL